jgi:hypothetical protein
MTDEAYAAAAWDYADNSDSQTGPSSYHYPVRILDSQDGSLPMANASPSQQRSSTDSVGRSWRDSPTVGSDTREPVDVASLVDASFDENVLRSLCELDVRYFTDILRYFTYLCFGSAASLCSWIALNRA